MNFTKLIIIFSAILQITFASYNCKFKPQKIASYDIQETIIGHSSMECCIHCRINFFCEAVMVSEGNNCILLTQIQSDTWVSDTAASDGSASDGSALDGSASDGSASDGSTLDGSASDASASDTSAYAYVLQNRPPAKINKIKIKTSNEEHADTIDQVSLEICNENSDCCKLEPNPEVYFTNTSDVFRGEKLSECQDFGLKRLSSVKISMFGTDGWLGEYLKIYLDNQGHFNCPIASWMDSDKDQELSLECTFEK